MKLNNYVKKMEVKVNMNLIEVFK